MSWRLDVWSNGQGILSTDANLSSRQIDDIRESIESVARRPVGLMVMGEPVEVVEHHGPLYITPRAEDEE